MSKYCEEINPSSIDEILACLKGSPIFEKLTANWEILAEGMSIPCLLIDKMRRSMLTSEHYTPCTILEELIINWKFASGNKANLVTLVKILEEKCGWLKIGEQMTEGLSASKIIAINEFTQWNDLPMRLKCELLAKEVLFLGRNTTLFQLTRTFNDIALRNLMVDHFNGKSVLQCSTLNMPVLAYDGIPVECSKYVRRHLVKETHTKPNASRSTPQFMKDIQVARLYNSEFIPEIICIKGKDGSGMTTMLAEMAKSLQKLYEDRYVIYVDCRQILGSLHTYGVVTVESFLKAIASSISTSPFATQVMLQLMLNSSQKFEIFLDSYDDICHMTQLNIDILKETILSNFRIILAIRREVKFHDASVCIYKIVPLTSYECTQILVEFLQGATDYQKAELLPNIANNIFFENLQIKTGNKNSIELPLKLWLLSELLLQKVTSSVDNFDGTPLEIKTVTELFQIYVDRTIGKDNFGSLKKEHTRLAIMSLYPAFGGETVKGDNHVDSITKKQLMEIGLVHYEKEHPHYVYFVHRTFAEYLAAEYFVELLMKKEILTMQSIINLAFATTVNTMDNKLHFRNSTLCHFLDDILQNRFQQKSYSSSAVHPPSSPFLLGSAVANLEDILCTCILNQHFGIFRYVTENMTIDFSQDIKKLTLNSDEWINALISASRSEAFEAFTKIVEDMVDFTDVYYYKSDFWETHGVKATPLHIAAEHGDYKVFRYLTGKFKNCPKNMPRYLIHAAVFKSYNDYNNVIQDKIKILEFLLENCGQEILCEEQGTTLPAPILMPGIHIILLKYLTQNAAKLFVETRWGENIAHNLAEYLTPCNYHNYTTWLIQSKAGCLFKRQNNNNETALELALRKIKIKLETLELIIQEYEENTNLDFYQKHILWPLIKHQYGSKYLSLVIRHVNMRFAKPLFCKDGTTTLLHVAALSQNIPAAEYILSLNVSPDVKDENGRTPLHLALSKIKLDSGQKVNLSNEMAMFLLDKGANPKLTDRVGRSPLSYILENL